MTTWTRMGLSKGFPFLAGLFLLAGCAAAPDGETLLARCGVAQQGGGLGTVAIPTGGPLRITPVLRIDGRSVTSGVALRWAGPDGGVPAGGVEVRGVEVMTRVTPGTVVVRGSLAGRCGQFRVSVMDRPWVAWGGGTIRSGWAYHPLPSIPHQEVLAPCPGSSTDSGPCPASGFRPLAPSY